MGLQLASHPTLTHLTEEIFKYFFAQDDLTNDEFLVCRWRNYHSSIRLPTSAWKESEDANLRQNWGSFVLAHDLHFGCDVSRASWEVYHPHFMTRQLGYLQGCPVPLLTSRSLLSRERLSGSSERECEEVKKEFQEQCTKFHLRLNTSKPTVLASSMTGGISTLKISLAYQSKKP